MSDGDGVGEATLSLGALAPVRDRLDFKRGRGNRGSAQRRIAAHAVNNVAAYAYAMFTTSVAELRAVSAISWGDAFWDIAGFALFAVVAWRIARAMRLATVTP